MADVESVKERAISPNNAEETQKENSKEKHAVKELEERTDGGNVTSPEPDYESAEEETTKGDETEKDIKDDEAGRKSEAEKDVLSVSQCKNIEFEASSKIDDTIRTSVSLPTIDPSELKQESKVPELPKPELQESEVLDLLTTKPEASKALKISEIEPDDSKVELVSTVLMDSIPGSDSAVSTVNEVQTSDMVIQESEVNSETFEEAIADHDDFIENNNTSILSNPLVTDISDIPALDLTLKSETLSPELLLPENVATKPSALIEVTKDQDLLVTPETEMRDVEVHLKGDENHTVTEGLDARNEFLDNESINNQSEAEILDVKNEEIDANHQISFAEPGSCIENEVEDFAFVAKEGAEETESLDEFFVGSTSGDFLDEEGGLEGAAEVEEDCLFLGDDEDDMEEPELRDAEDGHYVEGERQQGDGEESVSPCPSKEKVLDDDEDRRNPQYIPKKGSFYEHDDRAGSDAEEEKEQKDKDKKKTKKLWSDDGRWAHDMFREEEQGPKSREELVTVYGYDIRSEDGPPRARRRRRYGRGPNKYTRNWQDEDAYFKGGHDGERVEGPPRGDVGYREEQGEAPGRGTSSGSRGNRGYRGSNNRGYGMRGGYHEYKHSVDNINSDAPRIKEDTVNKDISSTENSYATAVNNNNKNTEPCLPTEEFPALPSKELPVETPNANLKSTQPERPASPTEAQVFRTLTFENSRFNDRPDNRDLPRRRGRPQGVAPTNQEKRGAYTRGRRAGGRGSYNRNASTAPPTESEDLYDLQAEMEKIKIQDLNQVNQQSNRKESSKEDASGPAAEFGSSQRSSEGRPKRYSSIRQRGLPETTSYQPPQAQSQFYDPSFVPPVYGGDAMPASSQLPPPAATSVNPMLNTNFPAGYNPAPYQENFALRGPPLPNPPRLYHPPTTLPHMAPVAGQPVVGTPYLAPNPGLINYAHPPPPPPASAVYPPQFQIMQPYAATQPAPPPPAVVSQSHEMYTGGITYYSPHGQQFVGGGRVLPQKRPKAAIPILPPPDPQMRGGFAASRGYNEELTDPSAGF